MDVWVGLPENHLLEETLRFKADLFILAVYTRWPPLVSCSHLVPHFCNVLRNERDASMWWKINRNSGSRIEPCDPE